MISQISFVKKYKIELTEIIESQLTHNKPKTDLTIFT